MQVGHPGRGCHIHRGLRDDGKGMRQGVNPALDKALKGGNGAFRCQKVNIDNLGFQHPAIHTAGCVDFLNRHGHAVQPIGLIGHADRPRLRCRHTDEDWVSGKGGGGDGRCGNGGHGGHQETTTIQAQHGSLPDRGVGVVFSLRLLGPVQAPCVNDANAPSVCRFRPTRHPLPAVADAGSETR